jgi:hypothetical protein
VFWTPVSITGVTEKNCTLPPRNVQGVDQVTTGIVMPRQLVGLEFRQPQSAVLAKYRPGGRGAPEGKPSPLTEHSGRFGKFGFLADQAKFPRSHGSPGIPSVAAL